MEIILTLVHFTESLVYQEFYWSISLTELFNERKYFFDLYIMHQLHLINQIYFFKPLLVNLVF